MFKQALRGVTVAPVVLWKTEGIVCTGQRSLSDHVEVRLIVVGVTIERVSFHDIEAASKFAHNKMLAYNGH